MQIIICAANLPLTLIVLLHFQMLAVIFVSTNENADQSFENRTWVVIIL